MDVRMVTEPVPFLASGYGRVPISFEVREKFEVEAVEGGLNGMGMRVVKVEPGYLKDYDAIAGSRPGDWAQKWDLSRWWISSAYMGNERVGGAVVAFDTAGVEMLEGRKDLAVLWDIRVRPDYRRYGVGTKIFRAAEDWARGRGCREMKVETQNINVGACRFYARQGCVLVAINARAYPELPGEVQLMWCKELGGNL